MLKRLLSAIIAAGILSAAFSPAALAEGSDGAQTTADVEALGIGYEHKISAQKPLVFMDFEKFHLGEMAEVGFGLTENMTGYPKEDATGGTCYSFSGTGLPTFSFDDPLKEGAYLLSFDFKRSLPTNYFYIRYNYMALTAEASNSSFALKGETMGYNDFWSIRAQAPYTAGTWAHVMMYMDFDNRKTYYVLNNEYTGFNTVLPDLYSIAFVAEGPSDMVTSIDNVAVYEFTPELRNELSGLGITIPDEMAGDMDCTISSKWAGNLFSSFDEAELNITHKNRLSVDITYDVGYVAKDYKGDIAWTMEKKDLKISANASVVDVIKPQVSRYDIYTLYVTLTPHVEGSMPTVTDREFSVVHAASPGYRNENFGFHYHPGRTDRSSFPLVKHALELSGAGLVRGEGSWYDYEYAGKGIYGTGRNDGAGHSYIWEVERYQSDVLEQQKEMGIEMVQIYQLKNILYHNPDQASIAHSEEALAALEKSSELMAKEFADTISIWELGNEVNFSRQEELSAEEYAIMSHAAYRGLKKGNPDCMVLSPGLTRADPDWIYAYLKTPGGKPCDAIAIHTYQEGGSPESKKWKDYNAQAKAAMARAGYPDMELWITEGDSPASERYNTESQHACNIVRHFAQVDAYDAADKFMHFSLQTPENNAADDESWFGLLRGPASKNAYSPKQGYLSMVNYIALTENAEFESDIQHDNIYLLRYKKADGSRLLMMYADRDCKTVALQLGAASGKLYDINGNATELYSDDGKYTFTITDQPIYFEYSGELFEECSPAITIDKQMIEFAKGNTDTFTLTIPEGAKVDIKNRDNVTVKTQTEGTECKVTVTCDKLPERVYDDGLGWVVKAEYNERRFEFGTQLFRDYINITVTDNGLKNYIRLPIEYVYQDADITMTVQPYDRYNTKYWKGFVEVRNNTTEPMSGTIKITSPEELAKKTGELRVENLGAYESEIVEFNIPNECTKKSNVKYTGSFIPDGGGEEINFHLGDLPRCSRYWRPSGVTIRTIEKTKGKAPVIDGVLDADEWKEYKLTDFDKSQVSFGSQGVSIAGVKEQETFGKDADYGGKADFSGTMYAQWDDEYFYMAALVYDDVHVQDETSQRGYIEDSFSVVMKPTLDQRHDTRIDVALTDFYNKDIYDDADRKSHVYVNWSQLFDVVFCGKLEESETETQSQVVRKENVTIYEVRIPWKYLVSEETLERRQTYFQMLIRDYDRDRDKTFTYSGWLVLTDTKK